MKKGIFTILLLLLLIPVVIPMFLSKNITVKVDQTFNEPVGLVFDEFNNLKNFADWNTLIDNDSITSLHYSNPSDGVGAELKWKNSEQDEKEAIISITEIAQNKSIAYEYQLQGWENTSEVLVSFDQLSPTSTKVTWSFVSEELSYFDRYYNWILPQEIESSKKESLAALDLKLGEQLISENQEASLVPGMIKQEQFTGQKMLVLRNETTLDKEEVQTAIAESIATIKSYLEDDQKINPGAMGLPTVFWRMKDTFNDKAEFIAGIPLNESVEVPEGFELFLLPSSKALVSIHEGGMDSISQTEIRMKEYANQNSLTTTGQQWEVYMNFENQNPEEQLVKLYVPVR